MNSKSLKWIVLLLSAFCSLLLSCTSKPHAEYKREASFFTPMINDSGSYALASEKIADLKLLSTGDAYPLSFLLGLCDQLQEWGRVRFTRQPEDHDTCVEKHVIDCEEVAIRLKGRTLEVRFKVPQINAKNYSPSFSFFNEKLANNENEEKFLDLQEILNAFVEGRLNILNKTYSGSPYWDKIAIFLDVGGVTYLASDFFKNEEVKNIIINHFYS